MTRPRKLFLLGGSDHLFDLVADEFVPAAGGQQAIIALLLAGSPGWETYVSRYTTPWIQRGITRYELIVPDGYGVLDHQHATTILQNATGIFIGGGNTPRYRELFAQNPIAHVIREQYQQGVPLAGLSAGALIVPHVCAIPPEDTGASSVTIEQGLGVLEQMLVGVHFTEWNGLPHLLTAMTMTHTLEGIGIDEQACVVLENNRITHIIGQSAYHIRITDMTTCTYTMTKLDE